MAQPPDLPSEKIWLLRASKFKAICARMKALNVHGQLGRC